MDKEKENKALKLIEKQLKKYNNIKTKIESLSNKSNIEKMVEYRLEQKESGELFTHLL